MMETSAEHSGPARRRGRWRTGARSRERILEAARSCFAQHGYDRATVREIAGAAGVDPAMVHYFFGSKSRLFVTAMEFPVNPIDEITEALDADPEELGGRIVRRFVESWDASPGAGPLAALLRSPGDERSETMFSEYIRREIAGHLIPAIPGEDPELRAELIGSHLIGLALSRYVLGLEPLASATPETLATWMGPAIQYYLAGTTAPRGPQQG
ncbi:TetR family transcriptional regulator [Brachybacterium sp. P6-10-X1]|uniref:TetR/AcrR family transcriptional regulator n=1 Tax=Brachybacterium sp. P6-10-X1 TaxID=1903186 RepID=UPI0009F938B1|nr:TetR family transcriptional regulator [Brachybacterium sp. P6-10-X1]